MSERHRSVSIDGERFCYLAAGDEQDPLVLCLHGFPDHPPSFTPILEHLAAAGFRAVAPWMRGYYPSVLDGPFHADQLARDVIALSRALSPREPVILLGHDWGAASTYAALALAPHRFRAAVTLAVPHPLAFIRNLPRQPAQLRRSWYMGFFQLPAVAEFAASRRDFAFIDRLWRDWSPGYHLPAPRRRALHECLARSMPAPLGYYRAMLRPFRDAIARARRHALHRIITPTLYLHGDEDGCIAPGAGRGQERFFHGPFASEIVTGAGHFLPLEAADHVATRAIAWVESQSFDNPITRYRIP